jgi:hypothetical protein
MALNLNKGDDNNSKPSTEKKGLNLSKSADASKVKPNLTKDNPAPAVDSKSSNINSKMLVKSIQSFYQRLINHCHRVSIDNHHISIESCCPKVIAFVGVRQWKALFNDSHDKFNDGDNSDDNGYNDDDDNCDDNDGNDNNSDNADIESNDNSYHSNVDYSSSNYRTNLGKHSFGINKVLGHSNKKLKSNHGFIIKNQDGFLQVRNSSWIDGKRGIGLVTTAIEVSEGHNYLWTFIPDSRNKYYSCKLEITDASNINAALELYLCVSKEENNDGFIVKVGPKTFAKKTQKWIFVNSDKKLDQDK